ncbi:MAG TPA: hypothetical protein DHW42_11790, partial [Candidatus Marinimicrobia bacterium]|nr:hypothetical protein [Candidatus Neomarinimicrobiota bacterium]
DRGRGARGQSYMQRLNEGLTGTGDLMNLMMYRTIGVPKSFEQMWGYRKAREQGVFGTVGGKPLLMGLMENYQSMFGGKYRAMAMMKASMPNMSAVEIEQTYKMFEGLKAGTWNLETGEISAKRRKELEAKGLKYGKFVNEQGETKSGFVGLGAKDWETLLKIPEFIETWAGKDKVSAGEKWKVQIESMQYSIGGIFGQTTISLLTGLAKGVDVIATKFGKDYGYESQARLIDEAYGQYQKPLRDELKGINERIKEIDKITEAAKDKEKGDPDYRSELTLNALIQEREKLKEKQKSSVFQWVGNLGTTTKPEGEIFDLDLSEWKKQSLELSKKGFVGSRLKNRIEVQKAKEKVIGEFWRKHTDLSTEEKIRQIKLAEEYIAKEIEKQNKIKLQEYYYGQIGSKQLELQKVNANIQYQEDKGLGYSKLDVKRSILQADINKLQKVNEIRASKLVIENPVDMGNRGATITNHYHIIVEGGGELFNLPINKETGLPDFFPIGPKDNE